MSYSELQLVILYSVKTITGTIFHLTYVTLPVGPNVLMTTSVWCGLYKQWLRLILCWCRWH